MNVLYGYIMKALPAQLHLNLLSHEFSEQFGENSA